MSWKEYYKPKSKKQKKSINFGLGLNVEDDEEYKHLEKVILGTGKEIFEKLPSESGDSDYDSDVPTKKQKPNLVDARKPAWVDDDDDKTLNEVLKNQGRNEKIDNSGKAKYRNAMEKKFQELMGIPKWAQLKEKKDAQGPNDFLSHCGEFVKKTKGLKSDNLTISKMKNLNDESFAEGSIVSVVKFHTKSMLAMVAGSSGKISLFQVDGKVNTKLQSIKFKKYPIYCGSFLKNGEEILIGSNCNFFHCHNMITGRSTVIDESKIIDVKDTKKFCVSPNDDVFAVCGPSGKIYLFSVSSKEFIDTLQMNCNVTEICFNGDGSILYSHGVEGEIYVWNMKTRSCVNKFIDDGCIIGTSLAVSSNNQFLATGSNSGVVNIYNSDSVNNSRAVKPIKSIFNLTTSISSLLFNSTCEILSMASNCKETGVKLLNTSSMTVFSNFPLVQSEVKKPMSLDFSKNSGFFAVGDNNKTVHLYRLKHYDSY